MTPQQKSLLYKKLFKGIIGIMKSKYIYSSSLLHFLKDKGKKLDIYILILCLLFFFNI